MDNLAERLANLSPSKRALLELKLTQENAGPHADQTIRRRTNRDSVPLSFAQERLWFLNQLDPDDPSYNQPKAIRLVGSLDIISLRKALDEIVARHEVLRTTFASENGHPRQLVAQSGVVELPVSDLRACPDLIREQETERLLKDVSQRVFDLSRNLPLRALLLRLADEQNLLVLVTHHIASDGLSSDILWRELVTLYGAITTGNVSSLQPLPVQYADYAIWQRNWLKGDVLDSHLTFWKKQLAGAPPVLDLPTDRPRPAVRTHIGAREPIVITRELTESLKIFSRQHDVTLFMTLLAAFQTLLHRYTAQDDIVTGTPIAGRTRTEVEGLIGVFVNTLALRTDFSGNPTWQELLSRVRETALSAYVHQEIPFEKLVEELQPERNLRHSPLFQVMFALQNEPREILKLRDLTIDLFDVHNGSAKFDLLLSMREEDEELKGEVEYSTDLFDASTILRMVRHFQTLLKAIVSDANPRIWDLPLLTESERHQILVHWNDTKIDYPRDRCIHELFENQVERAPNSVAVVSENEELSYGELNQRANQLANYLKNRGVGSNTFVGICVERSLEMIIAVLAILKTGAAYVPLDPEYPKQRLTFMLQDAAVMVILTQQRLLQTLPEHWTRVCLDADWPKIARENQTNLGSKASSQDLAYVIYTSGSTGKPKGVAVSHRAVNRLVTNTNYVQLTPDDGIAQASSFSFDASTFEIWGALLCGARLIIIRKETMLSPKTLTATIERHQITVLFLTTAHFNQLVDGSPSGFKNLNYLLFGGEAADPRRVQQLLLNHPPKKLLHVYGPTETTTFATWYPVTQVPAGAVTVPIGRPIGNTQIYVLDSFLQPVPIGVTGEIHIGGDGLAREYLGRPDLTAEKFVPYPFSNRAGARLYKTGDLARYLPDKNIEFVGRADRQFKIRGFRIEPKEIEAVLCEHSVIHEAAVLAREDVSRDKKLIAYVVPKRHHSLGSAELRKFLTERLPAFMVPSEFVLLHTLPLTSNGKLNLDALPQHPIDVHAETEFAAPRSFMEERLTAIWTHVLDLEQVGIHDNFFELGGHSLLVTKVIADIERFMRVNLPIRTLFEFPTIAQLAARIDAGRNDGLQSGKDEGNRCWVKLQSGQNGTSIFCFPYIGGFRTDLFRFAKLAPLVGSGYSFYGLQASGADGVSRPLRSMKQMVAEYVKEMKSLQPHGPYYLLGECFSGAVAYATAQQLRAEGQNVGLLAFMDVRSYQQSWRRYLWRRLTARLRYRIDRISEIDAWNYFRARTAFHLTKVKRLDPAQWVSYFVDKTSKGFRLLFSALRGTIYVPAPAVITQESTDQRRKSRHLAHAQKIYWLAVDRYRRQPYAGRITVLVNEEEYSTDPTLRWADHAGGEVDVHIIPGNHRTYFTNNIQVVAKELRECLETASAQANGLQPRITSSSKRG